jgi:hypothetical protein
MQGCLAIALLASQAVPFADTETGFPTPMLEGLSVAHSAENRPSYNTLLGDLNGKNKAREYLFSRTHTDVDFYFGCVWCDGLKELLQVLFVDGLLVVGLVGC